MIGKIPDTGLSRALDIFLGNTLGTAGAFLILFQNNIAEADINALSDLVECDFNGYGPMTMNTNPGFPTVISHVAICPAVDYRWDKSSGGIGNDVYGFGIVLGGFTELLYARRFPDAPEPMHMATDHITVHLRFTLAQG